MPKAYSYLRFSRPEQMRGDSLRRQVDAARRYADTHGLELDEKLTFEDLGVSAFRGLNAEAGRLGDFREAVKAGLVERGSYLLVESLDRLSRQTARRAVRALENIVDEGICVVTLSDGRVYTAESLDDDPTSLLLSLLIFLRANEESATKSRRLASAWQNKRASAADKPMTARAPAWLELDQNRREWTVLEDRAKVVRRLFDLYLAGSGQHQIAETFNREGLPTFGKSAYWHRSYIAKILKNPAVTGTFTPHVVSHAEGRRVRVAEAPVEGYFPAIVDPDVYQRVQDLAGEHRGVGTGRGGLRNILSGLARCPSCGGAMTRVQKGTRHKAGRPYLVCTKAQERAGCEYHAVQYEGVEAAIVGGAYQIADDAPTGDEGERLDAKIQATEDDLLGLDGELSNLLDALGRSYSAAVAARIRSLESARDEAKRELETLLRERAATQGKLVAYKLDAMTQALNADPLDRAAANAAMRAVLDAVVIGHRWGTLTLRWRHGGASTVQYTMPASP